MKWWERAARTAPLPVKRALKVAARPVDLLWRRRWRRRHPESPPIPPLALRARVGTGSSIDYYDRSGRAVAHGIEQAAVDAEVPIGEAEIVLDLGCGCGRVISHLVERHPGVSFTGCDVDPGAIGWAQRNLPTAEFTESNFDPPLPFANESFDLVYSISIFTHLPPQDQARWATEIRRVLKPGGTALLTFCGPTMLRMIHDGRVVSNSADFTRRVQALESIEPEPAPVFIPYVRVLSNRPDFPGIDGDYGLSFQTADQTSRLWGDQLELESLHEGIINQGQDLAVMRAPAKEDVQR